MNLTLQRIDEFHRPDHYYLEPGDACFFYGEYTARAGYSHSDTNDLILNFKKSVEKKDLPEWVYKARAIKEVSQILMGLRAWVRLQHYTWIPIPPSRSKNDPLYDDRLIATLNIIKNSHPELDVRELIFTETSRNAAHDTDERPTPDDHYQNFNLDLSLEEPKPEAIAIFDDVITTGSGFKAMQRLLSETYPQVKIIGVFIARTTRDADLDIDLENL